MAPRTQDELLAGRYRKLDTIGIGGMARVYLAEDERLGRRVAVKRLHADSPEEAAERFEREAKLGASLNHPNLVSIFDIAADGESVLIVMEYVDGRTLKDAIEQGPLPEREVLDVLRDVAAALDHAHAHGVVHRDVKPANILLRRDGTAKLADLGIATAAENTRITKSGMILGTAAYMAPEQLDGRPAGPAADVYSLATVAFEALTGAKARAGSSPMEIAHRVISDPPPDLREKRPDAPAAAAEALKRAMSKEPEDRPASSGELVAELVGALSTEEGDGDGEEREAGGAAVVAVRDAPDEPAAASATESPEPEPAVERDRPPASAGAAARARPSRMDPPARPAARRPAPRSRRGAPPWLPAAAVLAAFCVIGAIVLATTSGGGDEADRADRPESPLNDGSAGKSKDSESDAAGGGAGDSGGGTSQGGTAAGGSGQAQGGSSATGSPAELNDRGYDLMRAGRYDEAIPLLQRAVAAYPASSKELTYAYALYNLGRSLRLAGRADEAVPILERRLRIPNQTAAVRRELAAARVAAG